MPFELFEMSERPCVRDANRRDVAAPIYWNIFSGIECQLASWQIGKLKFHSTRLQ